MHETFVDLIRRYLNHEISLEDLEDWEASRFQAFATLPADDPIAELWTRFQSCIAELNGGHRTEEECRAELRQSLAALLSVRVIALGEPILLSTGVVVSRPPLSFRIEQELQTRRQPAYIPLVAAPS